MTAGLDPAAQLLALFNGLGAVGQINAIGTVTGTGTQVLPDPTTAPVSTVTLSTSGQVPFAFPQPSAGKRFRLQLIQDSTGSRTASFVTSGLTGGGAIQWVGHTAPTLTTTGARSDIITGECFDGVNWVASTQLNVG